MKHLQSFNTFNEAKAKPGPDTYHRGLSDDEIEDKEDQIKKQAEMDDDDPDAYKEMPGDEEAREKGEVKKSKHTKDYHKLYGDDTDEALSDYEDDEADYDELYKDYPYKDKKGRRRRKNEAITNEACWKGYKQVGMKDKNGKQVPNCVPESKVNEKAEGDRSKLDSKVETALATKSEETGVPIALLRIIYRRGMAAWKSGHRPGAGQEQWAYARVNSFLTKQPGTWGGADKDVAKEVRDGGHDRKLKKT